MLQIQQEHSDLITSINILGSDDIPTRHRNPALWMTFIVHASSEARLDLAVPDDLTTRELLCFAAFAQGIAMETERRDNDAHAIAITNHKMLIPRS